jgi:hypothetical protein
MPRGVDAPGCALHSSAAGALKPGCIVNTTKAEATKKIAGWIFDPDIDPSIAVHRRDSFRSPGSVRWRLGRQWVSIVTIDRRAQRACCPLTAIKSAFFAPAQRDLLRAQREE